MVENFYVEININLMYRIVDLLMIYYIIYL